MKQKRWHAKNSYCLKKINNKEEQIQKDTLLMGCRVTLSHQYKQSSTILDHEE